MASKSFFSAENIAKLFGSEAAEDEIAERLRAYYFKNSAYDQIVADLPLRILVGQKGIGKSALLKVAQSEDSDAGKLSVFIQLEEINHMGRDTQKLLDSIDSWMDGLCKVILQKTFYSLGVHDYQVPENLSSILYLDSGLLNHILQTLSNLEVRQYDAKQEQIILEFLETPKINVYLDDLDKGWRGNAEDVKRISALFNVVRNISNRNRGINFRIAIRSDVYYLVRTSDESTDKFVSSVIWHTWTNHEIFVLLIKRIETFFGRTVDEKRLLATHQRDLSKYLDPVMELTFRGYGLWKNTPIYRVLMSLIRRRPRDLVTLCTLAAKQAYQRESNNIMTEDFDSIFSLYSRERMQDTINEHSTELPRIANLIMNMKPNQAERRAGLGFVYKTGDLYTKINNISQLQPQQHFAFSNGAVATPQDLSSFLYKINFLTARKKTDHGIIRKYFEENQYLNSQYADFGFDWEIHPAYRWALQPDDETPYSRIQNELELSLEE